jgi:indolepyruvate ferredoxin oxidoreductase
MGGADVLVSPDLLDGSQHLGFVAKNGNVILDASFQMPLSILLDKGELKDPIDEITLQKKLQLLLADRLSIYPLKEISEKYLGKSVYASTMILGVAYQKGFIPFSIDELLKAINNCMPKTEIENNLEAFHIGRLMVFEPDQFKDSNKAELKNLILFKDSIREAHWFNDYENDFVENIKKLKEKFKEKFKEKVVEEEFLANYIHDLYIYDGGIKISEYFDAVDKLNELYKDEINLLKIALKILTKTFFIKDEIFIAHQMIGPVRRENDLTRYKTLGTHFSKTFINRPSFDLTKTFVLEFDFSPKKWMLKIMRQCRFLRHVLPYWHKKEREINFAIR